MIIKEFIPPILLRLFHSSKLSSNRYKNYDDALANCQANAYGNDDLVKVVIEKNIVFKNKLVNTKYVFV